MVNFLFPYGSNPLPQVISDAVKINDVEVNEGETSVCVNQRQMRNESGKSDTETGWEPCMLISVSCVCVSCR